MLTASGNLGLRQNLPISYALDLEVLLYRFELGVYKPLEDVLVAVYGLC